MKLGIDCGNSETKFYYFSGNSLSEKKTVNSSLPETKQDLDNLIPASAEHVIISSVVSSIETEISSYCTTHNISYTTVSPKNFPQITIDYLTPFTLGADRILNCASAANVFPGENVIIADTGTAVNIEILDDGNRFMGGMIFPGPETAAACLFKNTDALPMASLDPGSPLIGKSTTECISSGIFHGWPIMIRGLCDAAEKNRGKNYRKILTGGFAEILKKSPELRDFSLIDNFQARGFIQMYKWIDMTE